MREVKYRVWDGIIMRYLIKTNYVNQTGFVDMGDDHETNVWMQYTGLNDKNGVEIYDGDIFKALHDFGPGGMIERVARVHFDTLRGYQWNYWDLDTIEVIGNIYESPELLKN